MRLAARIPSWCLNASTVTVAGRRYTALSNTWSPSAHLSKTPLRITKKAVDTHLVRASSGRLTCAAECSSVRDHKVCLHIGGEVTLAGAEKPLSRIHGPHVLASVPTVTNQPCRPFTRVGNRPYVGEPENKAQKHKSTKTKKHKAQSTKHKSTKHRSKSTKPKAKH